MNINQLVGQWLRSRRENIGLSQIYIATQLGKTQSQIAKYESGAQKIDFQFFFEYCIYLNLERNTISDFFDELYEKTKTYDGYWDKG